MSWNLEGLAVEAVYLGDFPVSGLVVQSRVTYGGGVVHTVVLDTPITIYGSDRERVIVDHSSVTRVLSHHNQAA